MTTTVLNQSGKMYFSNVNATIINVHKVLCIPYSSFARISYRHHIIICVKAPYPIPILLNKINSKTPIIHIRFELFEKHIMLKTVQTLYKK